MSAAKILLGVTGGIAAYKAAELTRALVKSDTDVQVILTGRAEAFVTPLTLATLSGHRVWKDEFPADPTPSIGHIELGRWADVMLVAPATANSIARLAHGLADDLLSSVALVFQGPIVIAPAMNPRMWDHPETRANVTRLLRRGVTIVEPESGLMACGDEGAGRLAAVQEIVASTLAAARRSRALEGRTVLVTAGPTYEPFDPVRFIGNRSTGVQGFCVAAAAHARGAEVTLIAGPTAIEPPFGIETIRVETALQMHAAVTERAPSVDLIIMAAAVADHRPADVALEKLSLKDREHTLAMIPNPDILADVCSSRRPGQVIVGFAAETSDAVAKATHKRLRKGCDAMVANDLQEAGAGFGGQTNRVSWIDAQGSESWPLMSKRQVAERLIDRAVALLAAHQGQR
ncbi:MAG: bifunctional phosphopantothenoylcysteine decarboxylase/phosphopantothenate--cysteine ligase CoaBC [Acidobacteriota bacterium]